jgi:hypothetical protein
MPGQGVVVEGVKEDKYVRKPPEMYQNSEKTEWFQALIDLKIAKKAIFYLKILNRIYFRDFFEE